MASSPARMRLARSRVPALVLLIVGLVSTGCELLGVADASPSPSPSPTVRLDKPSQPVRVRVPSLGIDLPVMSSARRSAWAPAGYPACDVALAWTVFDLPGAPGTTWILAHAQSGMFLPLLMTSNATDGRGLLDRKVTLQLRDGRLLTYRTFKVRQRATTRDTRIAKAGRKDDEQRLILQTSTGSGDDPKLQIAARLIDATTTQEPAPTPHPRRCLTAPSG